MTRRWLKCKMFTILQKTTLRFEPVKKVMLVKLLRYSNLAELWTPTFAMDLATWQLSCIDGKTFTCKAVYYNYLDPFSAYCYINKLLSKILYLFNPLLCVIVYDIYINLFWAYCFYFSYYSKLSLFFSVNETCP